MKPHIALLRGINLGPHNRVAMPALRGALEASGFENPRTYVQSGNIVLSSSLDSGRIERQLETLIEREFGLSIAVVVRSRNELAEVVEANPLPEAVDDPKRFQVTFLSAPLSDEVTARLAAQAAPTERFVSRGRELYAWHPEGVARSKLSAALAGKGLGAKATARNWATVTTLLAMADE